MKLLRTLASFLVLGSLFCAVPSYAEYRDMWAYVYSWDGTTNAKGEKELTREITDITFKVLQSGTTTAETLYLYRDATFTSLGNPISGASYASSTLCNDQVKFRVDPGETNDTTVDLLVTDLDGGYSAVVKGFNAYTHTIVIDERPNVEHHGLIWFAASTAETDTGINFDYETLIRHVQLEVITVDSGETINIGTLSTEVSGDADGFVLGASVATIGYPLVSLATSGALMDDATNFDPDGHFVTSRLAKSLTHTGSAGSDTAAGYIHYFFTRVR